MEKVLTKECKWRETHHRLFRDLLNGTLSRVDGEKLERAVLAIAKRCIAKLSVSRHWRLDKLGISPYDLAVDAVTKLLLRDGTQHYAGLRKALERMDPMDENSPSICHYVHGIFNKLVLQACSEMLAEHDSVQTKMKRALRHHEEHTPELTLLDTIEGPAYHLASTDILPGRPYMPLEELSARIILPAKRTSAGGGGAPKSGGTHAECNSGPPVGTGRVSPHGTRKGCVIDHEKVGGVCIRG